MNETIVTVQGWVGNDVQVRRAGEHEVASFRIGCTPRRFHRQRNEWLDAPTQWYTVNAWRQLGSNAAASLVRGDAVVVQGRLTPRTWMNSEGKEVTTYEIEASVLGHDLNRGTARFVKGSRLAADPVPEPAPGPVDDWAAQEPPAVGAA